MIPALAVDLAYEVRAWAEKRARRHNGHNRPGSTSLTGYCGIASARLSQALKAAGIDHSIGLVDGLHGGHVFILIKSTIVDVTVTQFDSSARSVVIVPKSKSKAWYHRGAKQLSSAQDLVIHQRVVGWPKDQIIHCNELK
jgi:hypothetical protein